MWANNGPQSIFSSKMVYCDFTKGPIPVSAGENEPAFFATTTRKYSLKSIEETEPLGERTLRLAHLS